MSMKEIARTALDEMKAIEGSGLSNEHDAEILAVIERALHAATGVWVAEHAELVAEHLSHSSGVAQEINEEAERRRGLLMANLSAMR
ncbi:hypothetical protein CLV78_102613 [Aliiruegeria haliotis]|uniref:Uncharacterized protein n=1 Tax=Aliiruegeria haliotis TaxID=1280846 RepID=A0A2T0RW83_9RHOB|nr:hypothetical protein [Aliiruegeria haliotis]PRY25434.1 hypothetical protein CLV78_102613 [Aliiruegeria haliotis]